jgi:hypothetical protein
MELAAIEWDGNETGYKEFYNYLLERLRTSTDSGHILHLQRLKNICDSDDFRLISADNELFPLLENTDNENPTEYRNMPFKAFFLNQSIKFEDSVIEGLMVIDNQDENDIEIHFNVIKEDIGLYHNFTLKESTTNEKDEQIKPVLFIKKIIANLLDFLQQEKDYKFIETPKDELQNKKREKRGKIALSSKIYIKLSDELKTYAQEFAEGKKRYSYKFLVRGHMRHFRAYRYKNAKNKPKWIRPYWKGEGIIKKKDYLIKQ